VKSTKEPLTKCGKQQCMCYIRRLSTSETIIYNVFAFLCSFILCCFLPCAEPDLKGWWW